MTRRAPPGRSAGRAPLGPPGRPFMRRPLAQLTRIGWNERVLTRADFDSLCQREEVLVADRVMPWRGIYVVRRGIPCIAINCALGGVERSEVEWHEMGHHLLHTPTMCFFTRGTRSKTEYEAQVISACALVPRPLMSKTFAELQEEYGYSRELLWFRKRVAEQFRI